SRVGVLWPKLQSLLKAESRLVRLSLGGKNQTQVIVRLGVTRPEAERLVDACRSFFKPALAGEDETQVIPRLGANRLKAKCRVQSYRVSVQLAKLRQVVPEFGLNGRLLRLQLRRLLVAGLRLLELALG